MVTFTCQDCNSCLKKKAVENHLYKCKNPQLTCIDCLKDFDSKSYVGHVSCITENERYGGKDYVQPSGMQKQNQWNQCIASVLKSGKFDAPVLRKIVQYASEYPTCPRNKKKFINFIFNNKIFNKSGSLVETAFDLINEEFIKTQDNQNNKANPTEQTELNDDKENKGGKRKKISETESQEGTNCSGDAAQTTEKVSKKKNKKINGEVEENQNKPNENGEAGHKKNKKKNKHNNASNGNDGHVEHSNTNGAAETTHSKKKNKNKDKQRKHSTNQENGHEEVDVNADEPTEETINLTSDNDDVEEATEVKEEDTNLTKLSKKERKKLLKQQKYKAELESIENYKKEEEEEENPAPAQADGEKRKKKKKKHNEEEEDIRQQKTSVSEPDDKKIKLEDEEEQEEEEEVQIFEKPKKFKWDETILEVLRNQDDGEMSLKRLSKKVCSEYSTICGEPKSWEDVLLKFNKKIVRTPGVRVFKDRAKLLSES